MPWSLIRHQERPGHRSSRRIRLPARPPTGSQRISDESVLPAANAPGPRLRPAAFRLVQLSCQIWPAPVGGHTGGINRATKGVRLVRRRARIASAFGCPARRGSVCRAIAGGVQYEAVDLGPFRRDAPTANHGRMGRGRTPNPHEARPSARGPVPSPPSGMGGLRPTASRSDDFEFLALLREDCS